MLVDVAIPRTKVDFLTYSSSVKVEVGDLVLVPLRKKSVLGIVVKINSEKSPGQIREIVEVRERKFIMPHLVRFYEWLGYYYMTTTGEVLGLAFPKEVLSSGNKGSVSVQPQPTASLTPTLTAGQHLIVQKILTDWVEHRPRTHLIFGVTGSGKTEIYLRIIEELIKHGQKALVMVPEISMTPLLLDRFQERFGLGVVAIHSSLTPGRRKRLWQEIRKGMYDVIIGPRSCVFLPVPSLGLIVVDEEHDPSYKEESHRPHYNGRDAAVLRGQMEHCAVILGSATPSVESFHNGQLGKYDFHSLKERIDFRPMPKIELVDLKKESTRFISERLKEKLAGVIKRGEQSIIFLNRRGYTPMFLCRDCGFIARCPFCDLPLVFHKQEEILSCHYCNFSQKTPGLCPSCRKNDFVYRGLGTQRLEEILQTLVQREEILRLDRDSLRRKGRAEEILHAFERNQARILLGTQLVTKGFDFPNVTLVGIVNGDTMFHFPDFRAGERTFQLLTQVAGRCGRGQKEGEVVIQTYHPNQYAIVCAQAHDYESFYEKEIELRRELLLPPFARLVLLRITGKEENRVRKAGEALATRLGQYKEVEVYGPKKSFHFRLRNLFRYFILLKIDKKLSMANLRFLLDWQEKGVRLDVDVDPQSVI